MDLNKLLQVLENTASRLETHLLFFFLIEKKNFVQLKGSWGEAGGKSLKIGKLSMGFIEINCIKSYENNL